MLPLLGLFARQLVDDGVMHIGYFRGDSKQHAMASSKSLLRHTLIRSRLFTSGASANSETTVIFSALL
jgi:hypothetical protein